MQKSELEKIEDVKQKYKKLCTYCGHTMSFYAFEKNKKVCSHCGRYNYRNDLYKFKDLLQRKIKKIRV